MWFKINFCQIVLHIKYNLCLCTCIWWLCDIFIHCDWFNCLFWTDQTKLLINKEALPVSVNYLLILYEIVALIGRLSLSLHQFQILSILCTNCYTKWNHMYITTPWAIEGFMFLGICILSFVDIFCLERHIWSCLKALKNSYTNPNFWDRHT